MKKVISYSLYNNNPAFQVGAVINVVEARRVYPDWRCRFYTTDDDIICKQLEYLGAEIVRMDDWREGHMFWRFLAVDDSDICIIRDADSVVSEREAGAVEEWLGGAWSMAGREPQWKEGVLKGQKLKWHMMHDHNKHLGQAMMGGMWGCRNDVPGPSLSKPIRELMDDWVASKRGNGFVGRQQDQNFLREVVYPVAKESLYTHGHKGKGIPPHPRMRYGNFVGDYSFHVSGWKGLVR